MGVPLRGHWDPGLLSHPRRSGRPGPRLLQRGPPQAQSSRASRTWTETSRTMSQDEPSPFTSPCPTYFS